MKVLYSLGLGLLLAGCGGQDTQLPTCLSVLAGNDDFDTYSCPMEIK